MKKDKHFRQIFRHAVEKFSDGKLTENAFVKNGGFFHDTAISLLGRFGKATVLSEDHAYMLNHVLPRTWGLFRFGDDVANVLFDVRGKVHKLVTEEQEKPGGEEALRGLHKYMKPPYPISWIERPHDKDKDMTICYLVEAEPREHVDSTFEKPAFRLIQFTHHPSTGVQAMPGVMYVGASSNPIDLHLDTRSYPPSLRAELVNATISSGQTIMAALLLLNCRSPVFKFDADPVARRGRDVHLDQRENFEYALIKENQKYRAPSVIKFDLSRMMRHGDVDGETAHRDMVMHLVRGHFKLRKSGIWYWSHHMRGNMPPESGSEPFTPKPYEVVRAEGQSFGLPGGMQLG